MRPTKEQVDGAMELGESIRRCAALDYDRGDWRRDAAEDRAKRADVLAAEVMALRGELEQLSACNERDIKALAKVRDRSAELAKQEIAARAELRAKLARVEAVAEGYEQCLDDAERFNLTISPLSHELAIEHIRAAIR